MSETYDAVVVGAGPAGSAAAITLARASRRVLLLDRHAFPRDKPCGDLIGARAVSAALRLGVSRSDLVPYPRIVGAQIACDSGRLDLVPGSRLGRRLLASTDARVVPRAVFDALLVQSAVRQGADLRQATVRHVGPWTGGMRTIRAVHGSQLSEILTRAVVVAGGYGCRVASDVAPRDRNDGPSRGIARRAYLANVSVPADQIVFALHRWLLPGYAWVFPLPNGTANVGVGMLVNGSNQDDPRLDDLWERFTTDPASPAAPMLDDAVTTSRPRTWPLDLGPRQRRLVADGLLVAGEAAGLVGPLTGAGIAFALESGEAAARAIADALSQGDASASRLRLYGHSVRQKTAAWLRAELLAQRFLSDADRANRFFNQIRPLPPTGVLGARLLLHLG